jgi:outer membrane immunogenic protein
MKRILVGGIAIASVLTATSVFAADLPAGTYTKAPIMVDPGYNWTGFYAGLNGGYSWGRAKTTIAPFATIFPTTAFAPTRQDVNGGLGGGQIGYNWQWDRKWA